MAFQKLLLTAAVACLAIAAGAAEKKEEKPSEQPPPETTEARKSELSATDEALRASLKEYVGLSKDQEGTVYLTLSKGANLDYAANLAREVWTKYSGKDGKLPNFAFVEARATPEELANARLALRDVLTIPGVVYLDLDEHCGCISIGVVSKELNSGVAKFIKERGIYAGWVTLVQTPEYRLTADLTDKFRPTMGGQQIRTVANSCTLGLPVYSWDAHNEGILTASHCTQGPQGQNWGTDFFQGPSSADFVASETLDAPLFDTRLDNQCPANRLCRYSDVVYAHYGVADAGIRGRISRPKSMCGWSPYWPCDLSLGQPTDDIRIAYAVSGFFMGQELDKIGMRSGWSRGPIMGTCVDVNVVEVDAAGVKQDTGNTMLCQTLVGTTAQPGDSGAPVFEYHTGYEAGTFAGIVWGANLNFSMMVFSPIDGIEKDLGTFTYDQEGLDASFDQDGYFYTSNVNDRLYVNVARNAVPSDQIEVVLVAAPGISGTKHIVLEEGWNGLNMRWTIWTSGTVTTNRNGLFLYQLPGGYLEFRKAINNNNSNGVEVVSRVPIDHIPGGTRLTFTWLND